MHSCCSTLVEVVQGPDFAARSTDWASSTELFCWARCRGGAMGREARTTWQRVPRAYCHGRLSPKRESCRMDVEMNVKNLVDENLIVRISGEVNDG